MTKLTLSCLNWLNRQPLGLVWWMMFCIVELAFVGGILLIHQLVLHSWVSHIGFLHSWSVSFNVLVGDTLLSAAVATLVTLGVWLHRQQLLAWPPWLTYWQIQILFLITTQVVVRWYVLDLHRRPLNHQVEHHLAWTYDLYHVFLGGLVAWLLANGLIISLAVVLKTTTELSVVAKLILPPLLIGLYFVVVSLDRPALRFETGLVIGGSYLERIEDNLFTRHHLEIDHQTDLLVTASQTDLQD